MSYHKATDKFSSDPTVSFLRKSTSNMIPIKKWRKAGDFLYIQRVLFRHWHACVLSNSHQNNIGIIVHKYVNDAVQKALFYWGKMNKGGTVTNHRDAMNPGVQYYAVVR